MLHSSAKVSFVSNLSSAVQNSLPINEGRSPAEGLLYLTVFVQTVGYRVLIILINEKVTAPGVKFFFIPLSVCVLSNPTIFNLYQKAPFVTSLEMKKTYYFVLKMSVLPLTLEWCPGKTVTSACVGKVVATERSINFSSLPHMCYHHVQKGGYICKNPHFYSLTAKCTAHKCSSSVSYVYLI